MDVICVKDKSNPYSYHCTDFFVQLKRVTIENTESYINNLIIGENTVIDIGDKKAFPSEENDLSSQKKCNSFSVDILIYLTFKYLIKGVKIT